MTTAGSSGALSLDAFLCEVGARPPSQLAHERLMELVEALELSDELVRQRTRFVGDHYARNLVCRTQDLELLVLCWRPGQATTIHDHAGSLNAIRVDQGELTSRTFRRAHSVTPDQGPVVMTREDGVPSRGMVGVERGGIHQLANTSARDLVTIHAYVPPLMQLRVYATDSPRVELCPLRYTVQEDL
jgi:predicted metal-dependent enzyme (double-stranded beta helix superfamily)